MPSKTSSRSNSFLLIDTTGTAHPRGSSNPGQCHVNFAEGCHLYIAVTVIVSTKYRCHSFCHLDGVTGRQPTVVVAVAVPQDDEVGKTESGRACSKHHWGTTMEYYAGIDVSLESASVCVVDATRTDRARGEGGQR